MSENFGRVLHDIRLAKGLSQQKVAESANIDVKTIRQLEKSEGSLSSLIRMVEALDHNLKVRGRQTPGEIGCFLLDRRKFRKVSQKQAANALGVSIPTIISLEKSMVGRVDTLLRYLNLLGVHLQVAPKRQREPSGRRLAPKTNTATQDVVMTPPALAQAIVDHFQPSGVVLDPSRGDGAFFNAFPETVQSEWCEIREGRDFMDFDGYVDWIITNPPWSQLRLFLTKAMSTADNIVFLSAFIHYGTKARMADIRKHRYGWRSFVMVPEPRSNWPQSGFQLGAVHLQREWEGPCKFIDRIETWKETVEG